MARRLMTSSIRYVPLLRPTREVTIFEVVTFGN